MASIVKFHDCVLNTDHVLYAKVGKEEETGRFKFTIYINENRQIWWTFKNEVSANSMMDEFFTMTQTFMIPEFP